jgi:hypothetical protein
MSYFGVSLRNGVGLGLGTVPSLTNTPLSYRLAPALDLSFAGSDTLSPAITFSRTTNATLTNSAGLVANAPMNLLTYSEQFDNAAWQQIGTVTKTANYSAAPNGTTTADRLVFASNTNADQLFQAISTIAATYTSSVYARVPSGTAKMRFGFYDGTIQTDDITLTTEWQRFSVTKTLAAGGATRCCWLYPNGAGYATDIQIWGAQLETNATASTYNSTTVKNLLGYTENFDNAAWTKSNAFVQTNLLLWSQDFDNAYWTKDGATIAVNTIAAPDGTLTADKLVENTATSQHRVYATQGSSTPTISFYVKYAGRRWFRIEFASGAANAWFDVQNGVVGSTTGSVTSTIQSVGDGWYRITATRSATITFTILALASADGSEATYLGDGTSGIYIWGAQLVQGSVAGNYQATYAAAAAVGYTDIYGQPFAQKVIEDTANAWHGVRQSASTGLVGVFSFYAKAAERSRVWVGMDTPDFAVAIATFNLAAGTVQSGTGIITDVGSGWYRCSVTGTVSARGVTLAVANDAGTVIRVGDGTSGIYIFGAQLSDSASVDPYVYQPVAAPSSTAYYGPRFDYDPVTLQPKGLLIEEQRTNLLTYSQDFTNAAWIKTDTTAAKNQVGFDGIANNACLMTEGSAGIASTYQSTTVSAGATVTWSVYAKRGNNDWFSLVIGGPSFTNGANAWFNIATGAVGVTSARGAGTNISSSIQSIGNGWYRCSVTCTPDASYTNALAYLHCTVANGNAAVVAGATYILQGAQLEAGAFATSYIPTVASQVTRAADNASMIGNNFARWYTQGEGSLYAQADTFMTVSGINNRNDTAYVSNGSVNDSVFFGVNSVGTPSTISLYSLVGGANQADITRSLSVGSYKTAYAYKVNDFALALNGGTVGTDTTATVSLNMNQMAIGSRYPSGSGNYQNGHVQRITYYNRRLSNTELQGITA